jgi:hypothetical protein
MKNRIIHRPNFSVILPYLSKGIVVIEFERKDGTVKCSAFTQASSLLPKRQETSERAEIEKKKEISPYVNVYDVHNQVWAKVNPTKILAVIILE